MASGRRCAQHFGISYTAHAADLGHGQEHGSLKDVSEPHFVSPTWQGLYLGGHFGFGFGSFNPSDVDPELGVLIEEELEHDPDGGLLGLQAGYNWQRSRWVFGVEADIAASSVEGELTYDFDLGTPADTIAEQQSFDLDYLATIRGRIGCNMGSTLLFITAGLAHAKVETNFVTTISGSGALPNGTVSGSDDVSYDGWALGGGIDTSFGKVSAFASIISMPVLTRKSTRRLQASRESPSISICMSCASV